jgi:nanoRNase/pAp phosphatase (c-di-AMP/oligoRNAs hydrolase)
MQGYARLAKMLRGSETALVLGHQNADPDAVCSAFAFSRLALRLNKKLNLIFAAPDGTSRLSKQVLQAFPLEVTENPDPSAVDLIVTVDTNTLQQLGSFKEPVIQSGKPLVMIDHHAPHPDNAKTATLVICDETATSTCEMILAMHKKLHVPMSKVASQALLVGLLVETGHMTIATRNTFNSAAELIKYGADPETALATTRSTMDESERIARLKSAQRLRIERIGKWVIACSEVGSYHASAARGLIALGAHVAVVAGNRGNEITVSLRSTKDIASETGFHLGRDLASPLGLRMGGMGGGHATAAGANASGEANQAFKLALQLIRDFLKPPTKNNTMPSANAAAPSQTGVITQE